MSRKYKKLQRQVSDNNGLTWKNMDVYKVGGIVEGESTCTPIMYREIVIPISEDFACVDGNKHYQVAQQYSENGGLSWVTYGTKVGDLYKTLSEDCGVLYRWRTLPIEEDWICENTYDDYGIVLETMAYNNRALSFEVDGQTYGAPINGINAYKTEVNSYFRTIGGSDRLVRVIKMTINNLTTTANMFNGCMNLQELDVSNWDTSNVTDMSAMFNGCGKLTSLDVSNWDVSNVTNMSFMFGACSGLTSLDVSNWDVSNVTNMSYMFAFNPGPDPYSHSRWEILDLSDWDVSKVSDKSFMFWESDITYLNLSRWTFDYSIKTMHMFDGASIGTLDLSECKLNSAGINALRSAGIGTIIARGCDENTVQLLKENFEPRVTIITD